MLTLFLILAFIFIILIACVPTEKNSKNNAPVVRQITQTEDTGFETPTKPHGILGKLKGLFEKLRK